MTDNDSASSIVPVEISLPSCGPNRAALPAAAGKAQIEPAVREKYRRELRERVRQALGILSKHISQRKLERLLRLSQGYLSRLRSGAGTPSPELVSHLALIALDPKIRLRELESYWTEPPYIPYELKTLNSPVVRADGSPQLDSDGQPERMRCVGKLLVQRLKPPSNGGSSPGRSAR